MSLKTISKQISDVVSHAFAGYRNCFPVEPSLEWSEEIQVTIKMLKARFD
jgi:hypothetical protein